MWGFVLTDRFGNPLGELRNADERHLRFPLNRIPTLTFKVEVDNPASAWIALADKTLIKSYDDASGAQVLRKLGPVAGFTKERTAEKGTLDVLAAGIGWRLNKRLIGKSAAGATFGTTALALLDRGEIAGRMIDALNVGDATNIITSAGDTGIRRGAIAATASDWVGPWRYKPGDEVLGELSAPLDGFDWEIAPVEPTPDAIGVQLGALNIAAFIGVPNLNAAWEFGAGKRNVESWRDVTDAGALANLGIHLGAGFPDDPASAPVAYQDATGIADRGLYESVISGDVQSPELRLKLVQENVRIRKVPRRVISITPIVQDTPAANGQRRVPRPFIDFQVGDVMPFRATETFRVRDNAGTVISTLEVKTVDALFRCFALDLEIDNVGVAKPSLTLVQEG